MSREPWYSIFPSFFLFSDKFIIGNSQSMSTIIRLIDIEIPLNYALRYPILGIGNDSAVVQYLGVHSYILDYFLANDQTGLVGNYADMLFYTDHIFDTSNGILALLMQYGAVFTAVYLFGMLNFTRHAGMKGFFIIIIFTAFNEPITLTVMFVWFAVHGLLLPKYSGALVVQPKQLNDTINLKYKLRAN